MMKSNLFKIALILFIQASVSASLAFNRPYCINNEQKKMAVDFVVDYARLDKLFNDYKASDPNLSNSYIADDDSDFSEAQAKELYTEEIYKLWKLSKNIHSGKVNTSSACEYINLLAKFRRQHHEMPTAKLNLSQPEMLSLYAYMEDLFLIINPALRGQTPHLKQIQSVVNHLDLALTKLPPYKGVVLRGVNLPQNIELKIGGVFSDKGYLSTSTESPYGGTHQFIIHSKTGRKVDAFSPNPDEKEVLFIRDTQFKILDIRDSYGTIIVELTE